MWAPTNEDNKCVKNYDSEEEELEEEDDVGEESDPDYITEDSDMSAGTRGEVRKYNR